jgi:F-type H+-transporting ATPase subunit alpha
VREKVAGGDWSDETQESLRKLTQEFADDYGYDLDEEGQPLEEGAEGDSERAKARQEAEGDGDGSDDGSEEETEERETEAAPA